MHSLAAAAILAPTLAVGALLPVSSTHAAFPGQNGKIVLTAERWVSCGGESCPTYSLYSVNPDGSDLREIHPSGRSPAVSPDGAKVAFIANGLHVMNIDGSNVTQIAPSRFGMDHPSWAPDGRQIVFSVWEGRSELHIINADGSGERTLTDSTNVDQFDYYPAWSPDGKKVAFIRGNGTDWANELYTINVDGSGLKRVTSSDGLESFPNWSPDSAKIAFTRFFKADASYHIHTMNADGSSVRKITAGSSAAWSPDGTKLVISGRAIVNPDGSNLTSIPGFSFGGKSDWQPLRAGAPTPTTPPVTSTPAPSATAAPTATPNPNAATVTSFTLIDATTDKPVAGYAPLADGATLDLATLPQKLTVRANTSPVTVGSVQFTLDGQLVKTENTAPYAIAGDRNSGADYRAWTLPDNGAHTLSATAFSARNGGGTASTPLTIRVTIVNAPTAGD
jgi:dipeptidyl aminopeptidase/acylaminoacyl peptidase